MLADAHTGYTSPQVVHMEQIIVTALYCYVSVLFHVQLLFYSAGLVMRYSPSRVYIIIRYTGSHNDIDYAVHV